MKELIPMDEYGIFADTKDKARVNSLYVAEMFSKRHNDVLRDIKSLECSNEFGRRNFAQSSYINEQNKKQPCVCMTRDGFMFLVMGYRGKKAAAIKEAYINRFNEMEKQIAGLVAVRRDFSILTEAVKMSLPNAQPYHYSNEIDMVNRIVTGYSAREFRKMHGIAKGESIRPYMLPAQIELLEALQHIDTGLLISTPNFEQRKKLLSYYKETWLQKKCIA